jgi:uncharacterized protein YjbI with pentapeptide repeats
MKVTFWNFADDGILCGSNFNSAEFRGAPDNYSADFRGMKVTSAEFQKVPSVDTLSLTQNTV